MRNLLFVATLLATAAHAQTDLTERLRDRNSVNVLNQILKPYLFDYTIKARLDKWLNDDDNRDYVNECQTSYRQVFPVSNVLKPFCYFMRQTDGRKELALQLVHRHLLETKLALLELSEDPRYSNEDHRKAQEYLQYFAPDTMTKVRACLQGTQSYQIQNCMLKGFPKIHDNVTNTDKSFFAINLAEQFSMHPGHAVSETGWIGGNTVDYFVWNDHSKELEAKLESKHKLVPTLYPLTGAGSKAAFLAKLKAAKEGTPTNQIVFTEKEGFYPTMESHPVWGQSQGNFFELKKGMDSAKETIFIDVFFQGATMGAALAHHLIELLEQKPALKVFILQDGLNHFGHQAEMRPIGNFLEAWAELHPDRMIRVDSHIISHKSGLPKLAWNVVTDEFLMLSGLKKQLTLYGGAKSDHSKVVVIDGKSANPVAFVGSKNWTDASGGTCFDDVVRIAGPLAAAIQDDYYQDMFQALFRERKVPREKIPAMLKPFDLLERDGNHTPNKERRVVVNTPGKVLARSGFNNWDSTRTSALDQDLQLIMKAKSYINVRDQFLFDRQLVLALAQAVKRGVKVRAILEPLHAANPKGMPNLLYMDVLRDAGIKVKAKITSENETIAQEYHAKTLSADGEYVISGSANKDQTTMYGSFREEQVDVFDRAATAVHDKEFETHWGTSDAKNEHTEAVFTNFNFTPPVQMKGFNGQPLNADQFIILLRNFVSILYDSQIL